MSETPKLQTKHFFPFVRMVRALGGKQLLAEILKLRREASKQKGKDVDELTEEVGVEIMGILIDRLPDAENEIFDFLSAFTGRSRQEIEDQPITETIDMVRQIVSDPTFLDFFKSAAV